MSRKKAVEFIEKHGILLVYPLDNRPDPRSLWSCFFPKTRMRWDWTDDQGDNRVAALWLLREELSRSREVVYAKWFRGRATFFSRPLFAALFHVLNAGRPEWEGLSPEARKLLTQLDENSPLSTKELKAAAHLEGKANERAYERGLKTLWARLLAVGFGERDDGAFPSLLVGSTRLLFEDLWQEGLAMDTDVANELVDRLLPQGTPWRRQLDSQRRQAAAPGAVKAGRKPKAIVGWAGVDKLRD